MERGCTKFASSSGKPYTSRHYWLCHYILSTFLYTYPVNSSPSPLIIPSGGNAGLAAAYIARELGLPITVVIPQTTPSFIADKLREEGASVEVVGKVIKRHSCIQLYACSLGVFSMHARDCMDIYVAPVM